MPTRGPHSTDNYKCRELRIPDGTPTGGEEVVKVVPNIPIIRRMTSAPAAECRCGSVGRRFRHPVDSGMALQLEKVSRGPRASL